MDFVKRSWLQIKSQLEGLSWERKAIIALGLVLMLLFLAWLLQYAGAPERVTLSAVPADQIDKVRARLAERGIQTTVENGRVTVPRDRHFDAIALLYQSDLTVEDPAAVWRDLLTQQSPWQNARQGREAERVAVMTYAAQVIRSMDGVKNANVIVSRPEQGGFGPTYHRPTAAVTVTMQGGRRVDDRLVEAIAALVAGGVAEMDVTDVQVIDAVHGQRHRVNDEADALPGETLELIQAQQRMKKQEILDLLDYIDGLRVAVHIQIDPTHRLSRREFEYEKNQLLASEEKTEYTRRDVMRQGEPGARPNTGLEIPGAGQTGSEETRTTQLTEFDEKPLISQSEMTMAGHLPRQINVTVNVPRRYFVKLYKSRNPDAEGEPDDAALQPIVQEQLASIERQIQPVVALMDSPGVVQAYMVPDETVLAGAPLPAPSGGIVAVLDSQWAPTIGVAGIGLLALALMLYMVRKATQPESLPSIEELAGVPPSLPTDEDLVGEVEETEPSLAGVELDEGELQSRKIAEQISELIKSNPTEAGTILGRWVQTED